MPNEPRFSPAVALVTLARDAEVRIAGALEPHRLTLRKFQLLDQVARTPGLSHGELARRAGTTVQGVGVAVRALIGAGLLRAGGRADDEAGNLSVTRDGAAMLATVNAELERIDAEVFADPRRAELAAALATASTRPAAAPED